MTDIKVFFNIFSQQLLTAYIGRKDISMSMIKYRTVPNSSQGQKDQSQPQESQ